MTFPKTEEDLKGDAKSSGPEIKGDNVDKEIIAALKKSYPKAKEIEKLPSGSYAVRLRVKSGAKSKTVYWRKKH